jgi:hypothetical protein
MKNFRYYRGPFQGLSRFFSGLRKCEQEVLTKLTRMRTACQCPSITLRTERRPEKKGQQQEERVSILQGGKRDVRTADSKSSQSLDSWHCGSSNIPARSLDLSPENIVSPKTDVCRIVCKSRDRQLKLTQFTQHLTYCLPFD